MKNTIHTKNIVPKTIIVFLAILGNYLANDVQKMYASAIFISIAFISSILIIHRTFPFFFLAMLCFEIAILQEVWGQSYTYTGLSRLLWGTGNWLMGIAVVNALLIELFGVDIVESIRNIWKKIIVLLLCFFLFSCKTKIVLKEKQKEETKIETTETKNEITKETLENTKEETTTTSYDTLAENLSEKSKIEGEATPDQPFEFTQSENGVPKKVFKVTGNARINIETVTEKTNNEIFSNIKKNSENKQQKSTNTAVKIKKKTDFLKASKALNKNVKTRNLTFGAWFTFGFISIVSLALLWLFIYFRKLRKRNT